MSRQDAAQAGMTVAARLLDLDPSGARLVSASSRLIWHLPVPDVALTVSKPGAKSREDITAETAAMRAATTAGVRTPQLRSGPVAVSDNRWAFAADWINGHRPDRDDWPEIAAAAARLADAATAGLRPLAWPDTLDNPRIVDVLGPELQAALLARCTSAARTFDELLTAAPLVLAHTDLQPANVLCNDSGPWLLDLEYAALAPREWDPAKLVILSRRFGDPSKVDDLLVAWPNLDTDRLRHCVEAQEVLLVAWLARMAARGTAGAANEARHRTTSLRTPAVHWHHLA